MYCSCYVGRVCVCMMMYCEYTCVCMCVCCTYTVYIHVIVHLWAHLCMCVWLGIESPCVYICVTVCKRELRIHKLLKDGVVIPTTSCSVSSSAAAYLTLNSSSSVLFQFQDHFLSSYDTLLSSQTDSFSCITTFVSGITQTFLLWDTQIQIFGAMDHGILSMVF